VSGTPVARRRGIGPADLAVFLACVLAVMLAGPVDDDPPFAEPSAQAGGGAATPAPERLAAPVVDADGIQRALKSAQPSIALTFDDGPDPRWTPTVLDLLGSHQIKATFCLVGQHVAQHPELVRRIAAEGHALCNHTWSHDAALQRRSPSAVRDDLERTSRAIEAASGGVGPRYFRAPAGNWAPGAVAEARRLGLGLLGWSVDPLDWRQPPAGEITRRVLARAGPGAIVLLHDGYGARGGTVAALRTILPTLAAQNLRFVTP
jgi:peptidoglycan/xylan/chitin deacetylase (PgdA/CDA1 family)